MQYPADLGAEFDQLLNTAKASTCTALEKDIDSWTALPTHKFKFNAANNILPAEISSRILASVALRSYQDCSRKVYMLVNKHNADVNAVSLQEQTLGLSMLAIALGNRRDDVALALLDLGADAKLPVGLRGEAPITDIAFKGSIDVLKAMYKHGADMNTTNAWGNTVLVAAITAGRLDMVKFLLEEVLVNANTNGGTGLPVTGLVDKKVPLEHDVSFNITRDLKWSPLHAAVHLKHAIGVEMVKLLLKAGADAHYRCEMSSAPMSGVPSAGYTPLELITVYALLPGATNERHDKQAMSDCQALLEEAMQKDDTN